MQLPPTYLLTLLPLLAFEVLIPVEVVHSECPRNIKKSNPFIKRLQHHCHVIVFTFIHKLNDFSET